MIAKIGRGSSLYGALSYNQLKVDKEKGEILYTHKMLETPTGSYTVSQLARSFEPYLVANRNTEKPVLHISLNPDPKDTVSDEKFKQLAQQYMQEMGYGDQPFVVFKHTDVERTHIHIVSVCVDEEGKKISDKFEKVRSMKLCRNLETQYGLLPLAEKEEKNDSGLVFRPVNYEKGNIKSQIASVVRHLSQYYQYQTLGEYNALLSLFNITTEKIEGELHGEAKKGLVYFALNSHGEKASPPFKASLFGKAAGYQALEMHLTKCKELMKKNEAKPALSESIANAMKSTGNEQDFKKFLASQGINIVVRRNDTGRIYGVTFVDHNSKTVYNGSRLGKEFSANVFNELWKAGHGTDLWMKRDKESTSGNVLSEDHPVPTSSTGLFDFLNKSETGLLVSEPGFIEIIGGLLPEAQGIDQQEWEYAESLKKKKKKRRRGKQN